MSSYASKEYADAVEERFRKRAETEREYCEELYRNLTIRLMACKYVYYELDDNMISDAAYDSSEKEWLGMGRALGHLTQDDQMPCIGFDYNHPLAQEGIALAKKLMRIK